MKQSVSSRFVSSFGGSGTWIQLSSIYNSKFSLINIFHNSIIFMYSASLLDSCRLLWYTGFFFQQAINIHCNVVLRLGYGHGRDTSAGSALAQNRSDEWRKHPSTGVKLFMEIPRNSPIDFCINFDFPLSKWVSCNDPWNLPSISRSNFFNFLLGLPPLVSKRVKRCSICQTKKVT